MPSYANATLRIHSHSKSIVCEDCGLPVGQADYYITMASRSGVLFPVRVHGHEESQFEVEETEVDEHNAPCGNLCIGSKAVQRSKDGVFDARFDGREVHRRWYPNSPYKPCVGCAPSSCPACDGKGHGPIPETVDDGYRLAHPAACARCDGLGKIWPAHVKSEPCSMCESSGRRRPDMLGRMLQCSTCGGRGKLWPGQ